ncbi:MAG: four helix bundle protein [Oscillospiraceae bacterium]|nr:four helix bundle protein [Oscillospiraceae bacterium]MBR6096491.1 four helix bundle protein [Oscillospiraceae bacterium]MBR7010946.1 four helix bundle protein [Oscillospiraceae bacterium]
MDKNELLEQSFSFSLHIVKTCRWMRKRNVEWFLCDQLMRAGTSICANLYEAQNAHGMKDFVAKLEISMKESNECVFWIRLLSELGNLNHATSERLFSELTSIRNMLGASIRTAKSKS